MKKDRILYFCILAFFLLLYVLTGKGAFLLVVIIMALYALAAVLITVCSGNRLEAEFLVPGEAGKNERVKGNLRLKNSSTFPVFRCDMEIRIRNLLTSCASQDLLTCMVLPGAENSVRFVMKESVCGVVRAEIVRAGVSDPLRLFSKKVSLTGAEGQILVMPDLTEVEIPGEQIERYDMESFRYADGRVGTDSSETVGIRDYIPKDSVKAIHWKLSAKAGKPVIKEYGYPVDVRLMLIAEKKYPGSGNSNEKIGQLTELVLSWSLSLAKMQIAHSLGWYDASRQQFVCETVRNVDDVYALLPDFLKAPFFEEEDDACVRFLGSDYEKDAAGYFYFSYEEQTDETGMELLKGFADVTWISPETIQQSPDTDR